MADYFFKVGKPGTATTLSSPGYTTGDTSITVGSTANWPTTTKVAFAIDRAEIIAGEEVQIAGTYTEWTGQVTGATTIGSMVLSSDSPNSDQNYTAGSLTRVYIPVSATRENKLVEGILQHSNQDGTLITQAVRDALSLGSSSTSGWEVGGLPNITSVVHNGNRSYTLTHASSIASVVSPGMRRRFSRTSAAPITSFSLNGTNMYFNKTSPAGMTFTDDFVVSAWVKLESYGAGNTYIISRFNNTSGWGLLLNSSGQVIMVGFNGANTNYSQVVSYQSVPLNKWVHVAAQLDMSAFTATTTTSYVMIDGVDVPCSVVRGGTNPTALIQAGNLEVGSTNGGTLLFDGKLAQVAIYSAKVTQATIRASIDRGLTGSETSLISAYSGANTTDLASTGNNLTAQNAAVSGYADAPFGNGGISSTLEYALSMSVSSDGLTEVVQVPEGCALPTSGGITASAYSTNANPYGWVSDKGRWYIRSILRTVSATSSNATYGSYLSGGYKLNVQVGKWIVGQKSGSYYAQNVDTFFSVSPVALTGLAANVGALLTPLTVRIQSPAAGTMVLPGEAYKDFTVTTATDFTMYTFGATTSSGISGDISLTEIYAIPSEL